MSVAPRVRVRQGELVGQKMTTPAGVTYYSFQGIPYAKPPVGSLRFKAPEPAEEWPEARDATAEGGICAQFPSADAAFAGSEDCLYLNVYTPSLDGEFLPVLVWLHPGDFRHGSADADTHGPDWLVAEDIVVVTLNYRLGPLGFLALNTRDAPGNAGLKDQALALEWTRDNIAAFGGCCGNVTLAGAGTGASSASLLALSPRTKHLLHKLVLHSGSALNEFALDSDPTQTARALAKGLGCEAEDDEELFLFLQAVSARDLVETAERLQLRFAPVVEEQMRDVEAFLAENPLDILSKGSFADVPVLIGKASIDAAKELTADFVVNEDLRVFIPKHLKLGEQDALEVVEQLRQTYLDDQAETLKGYLQLASDARFGADIQRYVEILLQTSKSPIFCYKFSYVGGLNRLKSLLDDFGLKEAGHLDELGYLWRSKALLDVDIAPEDLDVRHNMLVMWTNFIKTGNPTPVESELGVSWLPTQRDRGYYLHIDRELVLQTSDDPRLKIWDQLYTKYHKTGNTLASPDKSVDVSVSSEANIVQDIPVNASLECESTAQSSHDVADCGTNQQPAITDDAHVDDEKNIEEIALENEAADTSESEPKAKYVWSAGVEVEQNLSDITVTLKPAQDDADETKEAVSPAIEITSPPNSPAKEESLLSDETETQDEPVHVITHEEINGKSEEKLNGDNTEINESPKDEDQVINVTANGQVDTEQIQFENTAKEGSHNNEILVNKKREAVRKTDEVISDQEGEAKVKHFEVKATNGAGNDIIRANDPPEDDLPKNIGVNKFVSFFESLGGKKK